MGDFRYVLTTHNFDYDTRHEAVGDRARFGDADTDEVVPIHEDCLVDPAVDRITVGPRHLGNEYFGDRETFPTTHGAVAIDQVSLVRVRNGNTKEVVESHWEISCPICDTTHESDSGSEDGRREVIDSALACCGAEWFPPSDWVEDCSICGGSHRGEFGCPPLLDHDRQDVPDDGRFTCRSCGENGEMNDLWGIGSCPACDSGALEVSGDAR